LASTSSSLEQTQRASQPGTTSPQANDFIETSFSRSVGQALNRMVAGSDAESRHASRVLVRPGTFFRERPAADLSDSVVHC
jgi:hypothetical protein